MGEIIIEFEVSGTKTWQGNCKMNLFVLLITKVSSSFHSLRHFVLGSYKIAGKPKNVAAYNGKDDIFKHVHITFCS